jgi:hypothetical protein
MYSFFLILMLCSRKQIKPLWIFFGGKNLYFDFSENYLEILFRFFEC